VSVIDTMNQRFSCRTYSGEPLGEAERNRLQEAAAAMRTGPFASRLRFQLAAAAPGDEEAIKKLGTYGTIRGAAAFIIGAAERGPMYLEDYGWALEGLVLEATALGLGTCWIGGFFARGTFARRIRASGGERLPAVISVGRIADADRAQEGLVRRVSGGSRRKPWDTLFFDGDFTRPLDPEKVRPWSVPLEMVRRAPSASNRQPWRVLRADGAWHFYIRRTPGYPPRISRWLMGIEDLQRVDSGIGMCHFELAARESGLPGRWVREPPAVEPSDALTEYSATWKE
jgi:nitroreductase